MPYVHSHYAPLLLSDIRSISTRTLGNMTSVLPFFPVQILFLLNTSRLFRP